MGRGEISFTSDILSSAAKDIHSMCPGVLQVRWDGPLSPHMVTIMVKDTRIRIFVETSVLAERGDLYEKFLDKAFERIAEALRVSKVEESDSVECVSPVMVARQSSMGM